MQEQLLDVAEPGRRPTQQFAGVDLRRPKGYAAAPSQPAAPATAAVAAQGEPCPRCESRDTKFCYYNNYNTSQPRHFCKCCRRYWTKGGTLRNVPVGGGTRKKSSSSSSSSSSPSSASSPAAAKRQKPSKKRRVEPHETATSVDDAATAPDPESAKTAETTATATATATTTPPTDAASEITTELVVPAVEEDSFTDLLQQGDDDASALELGFSDYSAAGGKALGDPYSFEWPPAFDLGAYWSGAGLADPDPAAFMNLP